MLLSFKLNVYKIRVYTIEIDIELFESLVGFQQEINAKISEMSFVFEGINDKNNGGSGDGRPVQSPEHQALTMNIDDNEGGWPNIPERQEQTSILDAEISGPSVGADVGFDNENIKAMVRKISNYFHLGLIWSIFF